MRRERELVMALALVGVLIFIAVRTSPEDNGDGQSSANPNT
jgi:hypothetical protein